MMTLTSITVDVHELSPSPTSPCQVKLPQRLSVDLLDIGINTNIL